LKKTASLKLLVGINIDGYHRILKLLEGNKTHIEDGFDGSCFEDNPVVKNIPDYEEGTVYVAELDYYIDTLYEVGEIDFEYRITKSQQLRMGEYYK
jgi:hypothetical protein